MNPLSERLRRRREELTLSVKEISSRTKIRPNVINALEEGNFDVLPRVYITSFVRNYGALLEIPEEELDELWIASGLDNPIQEQSSFSLTNVLQSGRDTTTNSIQTSGQNSQTKASPKIKPVQPTPKIISAIVYSAFVIFCSALVYYFFIRDTSKPRNSGETVPTAEIRPDSGEGGLLNSLFEETLPKDSIILEATATDSVWLTINADGKKSDQLLMINGNTRRWSAKMNFILSLGNAGAIEIKRDNVVIPSLGKKGTALRYVKITKNEIITSSSPYKNQDSLTRIATNAAEKRASNSNSLNVKTLNNKLTPSPIKSIQNLTKKDVQPLQINKPAVQTKQTSQQLQIKPSTSPKLVQPTNKVGTLQPNSLNKTTVDLSKSQPINTRIKVVTSPPSKSGNPLKIAPPTNRNNLKSSNFNRKQGKTVKIKKPIIPISTAPLKQPTLKHSQPQRY